MKSMSKVIHRLKTEHDFQLEDADAIELFAREGNWHTTTYAPYVKSLEAWEIDPKFREGLTRNLPNAKIKITDTWREIKTAPQKYDLIVVDAPNSTYGEDDEHCESFGLLPDVLRIAHDGCVIILSVNMSPYNLREGSLWWTHRAEYYKTDRPDKLEFSQVAKHYEDICRLNSVEVEWRFFQQRSRAFMYYYVMRIRHRWSGE